MTLSIRWLRLYVSTCAVAAVVGVLLFHGSTHSADEIAVTIAMPLLVLQLTPFILTKIPHHHGRPPATGEYASPRVHRVVQLVVLLLTVCATGTVLAVCTLLSLPVYHALGFQWAVRPASRVALLLVAVTGIGPIGFLFGIYSAGRIHNFGTLLATAFSRRVDPPVHHQHAA
jgi:hypothetical protein